MKFAANARSAGADLDKLHAKYRVSSIRPVFSSLFARAISTPGKGAVADRRRKLVETVNAARTKFAARAARAGPRAEIPDLVHVYVLEVPADTDLQKMANDFAANPNVVSAVPDQLASTQALPDDPYLASSGSWGQPYEDLWALATIGAPEAWEVATGLGDRGRGGRFGGRLQPSRHRRKRMGESGRAEWAAGPGRRRERPRR